MQGLLVDKVKKATRFCLPIICSAKSAVLEAIRAGGEFDLYEIWLDYVKDLEIGFVEQIEESLGERALFVLRRQNLEPTLLKLEKRTEILERLQGKSFLDLDVLTQTAEFSILSEKQRSSFIGSYHNYLETPPDAELREIVEKIERCDAKIIKVATHCKERSDGLRLLSLLLELKKRGKRCIVLGMGEHGKITRIFGPLWGNEFTFAPKRREQASASGQLTLEESHRIFSILCAKGDS